MRKRIITLLSSLLLACAISLTVLNKVEATTGWGTSNLDQFGRFFTEDGYEYTMGLNFVLDNDPNSSRLYDNPATSGVIDNNNLRDRSTDIRNDDRRGWQWYWTLWADSATYNRYLGFNEYTPDDYNPFKANKLIWGIQDGGSKIYTNDGVTYNRYRRLALMIYRRPKPKATVINNYINGVDGGSYRNGNTLWVQGNKNIRLNVQGISYYDNNQGNQYLSTTSQYSIFHIYSINDGVTGHSVDFVKIKNIQDGSLTNYDYRTTGEDIIAGSSTVENYYSSWAGETGNIVTNQLVLKPTYDVDLVTEDYNATKYGDWSSNVSTFWQNGYSGTYNWLKVDCNAPTSNSVTVTKLDGDKIKIDLYNCTDSRSGVADNTVRVAVWKNGDDTYRDWYTLTRVPGTNNFTTTVNLASSSNNTGKYGTYNAHVYAADNVTNDGYQTGTTFERQNPVPINNGLYVKDYDYKESNSIYWMKTGNQFRVYNDGYFPTEYGMYPSQNFLLFRKDGTESFDTAARYYADTSSNYSYGASFSQYFGYTGSYVANQFQGLGHNYLASDHVGKGTVDNTSFLLYHCTTYLAGGTQYYNGYVDSGIWMKFDGRAPTYTKAYAANVTPTGFDVIIEGVSDNNGSGVKAVSMPTWTVANDQDEKQSNTFVNRAYLNLLGRAVDSGGSSYYCGNLDNAAFTEIDVLTNLIHSSEYVNRNQSNTDFIKSLYRTVLTREASQSEIDYWNNFISGGNTKERVINAFCTSDEFNGDGNRTSAQNLGNGKYMIHVARTKHNGEFGDYLTHIYLRDNVGNYTNIPITTTMQVPNPINNNLEVRKYDYKESSSVYWMKTGNEFAIYNDGYFPSSYEMYPTKNFLLFQRDGTENIYQSAKLYSDINGNGHYDAFDLYFNQTTSYKSSQSQNFGNNYLSTTHYGKGMVDNTSFKLMHCTTLELNGVQYYSAYKDSGIWMKFDGKAPTYTRAYATNYTTSGYDVIIEGVSDNNGSGVKSITMPTYTAANGKDDLQTYSFIKTAYSELLQRVPSTNELNYYATNISNGVINEKDLINDLTHDVSFNITDDSQFVYAVYDIFFNRYPTQDEDEGWCQNLALGYETRESLVNSIFNDDEFNSFRTTAKNLGSGKYMVHVDISQHNYEIANYNTDICLRDNVGNYTIVTVSANINQKPSAKFTVISPILANTDITYTDYVNSGDSWDSIKSDTWQWSIDNKTWTNGKPTKFDVSQFPLSAAYGDYYIRRQVVDTGHGTDSITSDWYTQTLRVYRYNTKPTAYFTATSPQYIGFTIQYTESSSPQDQWDKIVAKEWSYSLDGGKTWSAPSTVPPSKFDNPGVYKVRLRVKDTGNILSPGIWSDYYIQDIQILDLSVVGEVKHTDRWNENRIKYNRSKTGKDDDPRTYDVFFPGEMFVLSSVTTIPANGVSVQIQGTSFSTDLASDDGITWSGQLWDESMIDWTDRNLNFIFTAKYPNNIAKQCIVPVKVVYDEYWRQHREF